MKLNRTFLNHLLSGNANVLDRGYGSHLNGMLSTICTMIEMIFVFRLEEQVFEKGLTFLHGIIYIRM